MTGKIVRTNEPQPTINPKIVGAKPLENEPEIKGAPRSGILEVFSGAEKPRPVEVDLRDKRDGR